MRSLSVVSLLVVNLISVSVGHVDYSHEGEGIRVEPFHEIMHAFNISSVEQFNVKHLQHIVSHFAEHFHCMGGDNTLVSTLRIDRNKI